MRLLFDFHIDPELSQTVVVPLFQPEDILP